MPPARIVSAPTNIGATAVPVLASAFPAVAGVTGACGAVGDTSFESVLSDRSGVVTSGSTGTSGSTTASAAAWVKVPVKGKPTEFAQLPVALPAAANVHAFAAVSNSAPSTVTAAGLPS